MDEQRLAHEVPGEPLDNLDRIVFKTRFDVPGIRPARPGELRHQSLQTEHEDFRLDGALGVKRRAGIGLRQAGRAMASTCSRLTVMLCASSPCF